tara:strand:- start:5645 stop:7963 length:2319 start_codon:yes stop_codon:yes gene_type:complete
MMISRSRPCIILTILTLYLFPVSHLHAQVCEGQVFGNQRYEVGIRPFEVEIGDFNGDGHRDIVLPIEVGGYLRVLIGNGDGTFTPSTNVAAGSRPAEMEVADLDGDGNDDFIIFDASFSQVRVTLNSPFPVTRTYSVGDTPFQGLVADLNNDQILDIAVTSFTDDVVSVLLGTGQGEFASPVVYDTVRAPDAIVATDLNNDGFNELIVSAQQQQPVGVEVFMNNGDGTYADPTALEFEACCVWEMKSGDLNNDGLEDLLVVHRSLFAVYLNDGNGGYTQAGKYLTFDYEMSGDLVDIDGDGDLDLGLTLREESVVWVYENDGSGGYAFVGSHRVGVEPVGVRFTDTDGDGILDMLVANNYTGDLHILRGKGGLGFESGDPYQINRPNYVRTADFNGDDAPDLLVTGQYGNASIFYNDGSGRFDSEFGYSFSGAATSVDIGDLDADGFNDLVVAIADSDEIAIVYSDPFAPKTLLPISGRPGSVRVVDMNNDNALDIVATTASGDRLWVLLNDGAGAFAQQSSYLVGDGPVYVQIGDLDLDGHPDVIVSNQQDATLTIRFNDGQANMSGRLDLPLVSSPWESVVADLDGDGLPDIVTACVSGYVSVTKNLGDRNFGAESLYEAGRYPYGLAAADFNGDSVVDIAAANNDSDDISLFINLGDGTFGTQLRYTAGERPFSLSSADLNLDGSPDLAIANYDSDEVMVLFNQCESGDDCLADFNDDGTLTFFDVSQFLVAYLANSLDADFDLNGELNFFDVSIFLQSYASGCGQGAE